MKHAAWIPACAGMTVHLLGTLLSGCLTKQGPYIGVDEKELF